MDFGLNYGWVCPVCGKANAPWVSQCTCKGKLLAPCEPTNGTGTTGNIPTQWTSMTQEDFQKAIQKYTTISDDYSTFTIYSNGETIKPKPDIGPADSTTALN